MEGSAAVPPDEAVRTLASIHSTRQRTRGDLRSYWFPLVVFGLLTMLSTPLFWIWDGAAVGLFWLFATPIGVVAVVRHDRDRERTVGVGRNARAYALTAGLLIVACFGLGFGGGVGGEPDIATFGPPLAVAAAYVVFAWLERSIALLALTLAVAAATIAFAVSDIAHAAQYLALGYGGSLAVLGALARSWTTQR